MNDIRFLHCIVGILVSFIPSISYASKNIIYDLSNFQIGVYNDSKNSTGSTLFYFPRGAYANFDSRGGSVSSTDISLLHEGSLTNYIDGIVFNGGSTMGLGAVEGVKEIIFNQRIIGTKPNFNMIPVVLGAVIYDYSGRVLPGQDLKIYPNHEYGKKLMGVLSSTSFPVGRIGAGVSATINKVEKDKRRWGGQGASFINLGFAKAFTAVVLNSIGDIIKDEKSISSIYPPLPSMPSKSLPGQNTTLSIVVTDAILDRNQLKRLAVSVHTAMAQRIKPFHTYSDGDILFAVSTNQTKISADQEFEITLKASDQMLIAIENSLHGANL